ncbi:MAG: AMP-binding protein [Thermodesulfobacteriota bacterium]
MIYEERPWLKSYDPGVPPEIVISDPSLCHRFDAVRRAFPDRAAFHFLGRTLTFEEFFALSDKFASFLNDRNLGRGDVVTINLPNLPQFLIALVGALRAGCAASGLSPLNTADEMAYQINDSGTKVLVTLDAIFEKRLAPAAEKVPGLETVVVTGLLDFLPRYKQVLAKWIKKIPTGKVFPLPGKEVAAFMDIFKNRPSDPPPLDMNQEDLCLIQYTGGTTGRPKGAELTHRNLLANVLQFQEWTKMELGKDVILSGFPFFHLAGLAPGLISLSFGVTQVLIPNPRDTKHMTKEFARYKPTFTCNVPSLYQMLVNEPGFRRLDFSNLQTCISGAAPFSVEGINQLHEVVGPGKLLEVWGMTETSPLITVNPSQGTKKIGSVGLPLPSTRLRVVDLETGENPVPLGEEGELIASGPQVMRGYHNNPEETARALREHDGAVWMHTGDVGRMDEDGFVYVVDRAKDMLIVGGFKVFSAEVEDKFYQHPAIGLCALIGLPNPDRPDSEIVKLVVQKSDLAKDKPDEELRADILAFAREKLAPYKVPKIVEFVEAMPLTAVGKVDKKALRPKR